MLVGWGWGDTTHTFIWPTSLGWPCRRWSREELFGVCVCVCKVEPHIGGRIFPSPTFLGQLCRQGSKFWDCTERCDRRKEEWTCKVMKKCPVRFWSVSGGLGGGGPLSVSRDGVCVCVLRQLPWCYSLVGVQILVTQKGTLVLLGLTTHMGRAPFA